MKTGLWQAETNRAPRLALGAPDSDTACGPAVPARARYAVARTSEPRKGWEEDSGDPAEFRPSDLASAVRPRGQRIPVSERGPRTYVRLTQNVRHERRTRWGSRVIDGKILSTPPNPRA
jgi:hypothetical protein